uniref:Uncharacterized protein n=1 Tax=Pyramimonas orientalis virus TaxID=455367 RepID=A0A7M3UP82_POV01|nr:hypothetical protein HWQ62_00422 [Pyramimonas orientalis virus]
MVEYPEDDMLSLFNKVGAKQVYAYPNENRVFQDLNLGASGHVNMKADTIEVMGDSLFNSNVVVNGSGYYGDLSIFRTFPSGHTISYCLRVSDQEKLQFFKHDSRQEKSVLVNQFGLGAITTENKAINETTSDKLNDLYDKAKLITRSSL